MIDVLIHSPYPRQRSQGNAVTAKRMVNLLRDSGLAAALHERGDAPLKAKCLIALNGRKGAEEIFKFLQRQPDNPVIALLTGTDVNHPEMEQPDSITRKALELSTAIVSLHDGFAHRIPKHLLEKTEVIYPSVMLPDPLDHSPSKPPKVIIAGNFRAEKNPSLMMKAVREMKESPLHFHAYGQGGDYQRDLERTAAECPHFYFHGVKEHDVLLGEMQAAHVLLNTSTQEGGANAICEAIALGLPVVASRIAGNMGMLGENYAGFFPVEEVTKLIEILGRAAKNHDFYQLLKEQIATRAPLFSHQRETEQWVNLIHRMLK